MKKFPKPSTIRSRINFYAYKVGMSIVRNANGTYDLFDMKMEYHTHRNVNMDTVVRVVTDELYTASLVA